MTIAAIHYYKKYQRRCTDFELVGTATQKQPPLHTALEPSACPATATPQNSGQSALADPDYDVMDNNQEQITSSDIPLALNDASTQLISSDITFAENDVYYVNAQFSSSVVPLSQNDAYNATIHNISFSDVPLAQSDALEPSSCQATDTPLSSGQSALAATECYIEADKQRQS